MSTWPYPGDSPLARARRIAQAYREHLMVADPDACTRIDAQLREWGEAWMVPRTIVCDLDDWLDPADAADLVCVTVATIRQWRGRGRLAGRHTRNGWRYRARDVIAVAATARKRKTKENNAQRVTN
jgi:hypothetical protein